MKKLLLFVITLFWISISTAQTNFIHQDSIFGQTSNCAFGVGMCIDSIAYDDISNLRFYVDGRQFSTEFTPCIVNTIHNYSYADIYRGGERGPWQLESWTVNGVNRSTIFSSLTTLLDSMRRWNPSGNWQLEDPARIIFGFVSSSTTYTCQNILGTSRGGRSEICYNQGVEYRGLRFNVPVGVHQLIVEKVLTGERDTVTLLAACIAPETVRRTVNIGTNQTYCADLTQLLGTLRTSINFCNNPTTHATFDNIINGCIRFTGTTVGIDTACLRVCDNYGFCDTTTLIVTVENVNNRTHTLNDTISIGATRDKCEITLPNGNINIFENICPANSGNNVRFTLNPTTHCVNYTGLTVGTDTACVRACNTEGVCDTTFFYVNALQAVLPPPQTRFVFNDTITIGTTPRSKCTFNAPSGNITIFENICAVNSGSNVIFTVDAQLKCVTYRGISVGVDTGCMRICNANGQCDTTYMYINALNNTGGGGSTGRSITINDTISVGNSRQNCSVSMPNGSFANITNLCPTSSGTHAVIGFDAISRCVTYRGISLGVDTACIQVCSTSGVCDTTKYIIRTLNIDTSVRVRSVTIRDTISVGNSRQNCNFLRPSGNFSSLSNVCENNANGRVVFQIDFLTQCLTYRGLVIGNDTACIQLCNTEGVCDTTRYIITAVRNPNDTTINPGTGRSIVIRDTISIGNARQNCAISLPSTGGVTINNICPTLSSTNVVFDINTLLRCVTYRGVTIGTDTACLRVCSATDICDTTTYIITTISNATLAGRSTIIQDTISVGANRVNCTVLVPTGTVATITNICAANSGTNINFSIDNTTRCVTYRGLAVGKDTACFKVCNTAGTCDTTTFIVETVVNGLNRRIHAYFDTISVGINRPKCSLTAPPSATRIRNICAGQSGTNVAFSVDNGTLCVDYRGVSVGIDTACIEICDAVGLCDTTFMQIETKTPIILRGGTRLDSLIIQAGDSTVYCLDSTRAGVGFITGLFTNFTYTHSVVQTILNGTVTTACFKVKGFVAGRDTVNLLIVSQNGVSDTTRLTIIVLPNIVIRPTPRTDSVSVFVGDSLTYCNIDTSEINGRVDTIYNVCQTSSGTNATVKIVGNCVKITGLTLGIDTACIVVGNRTSGLLDTTRVIITVKPRVIVRPTPSSDTITLKIFETKTYCPDSSELRGSRITLIKFCSTAPFNNSTIQLDTINKCVKVRGTSAGVDTFCIALCNEAGFCDTTTLFVKVTPDTVRPVLRIDTVRVIVGDSTTYCGIDTSQIRGRVDTIYNICSLSSGTDALVQITIGNCVKIKGLRDGIDTACIVVCNRLSGLCDTTRVVVIVSKRVVILPKPSIDSIRLAVGQTRSYCPDTLELRGSPVTSIGFCAAGSFDNSIFLLDNITHCATIRGTVIGRDTACLVVCNAAGLCDTTTLTVIVIPRDTTPATPLTVIVPLLVGKDTLFCGVDTMQIRGAVDTIYDACPAKNGLKARMVINKTTKCVQITGLNVGRDTICVVVCNRLSGICDTTTVVAEVGSNSGAIIVIANNDFDSIRRGKTKILEVYKNDTFSRRPTALRIIKLPTKGKADTISFGNGLIKYEAGKSASACGLDSFSYRVCVDSICDTALVVILVVCPDSLRTYSAVSPNGDGRNDAFIIDGLQNYPNHTVCIFNRWGNEVLNTKNYQNDWSGTWGGKNLPDGTYFYYIRNDDNGEVLLTGNVQLLR